MNIERKTFRYTARQEESWMKEKPTDDQEVVPMDLEVFAREGFLGIKKDIQKGWRCLNEHEVLQQVFDFVNGIGKERLVDLCEHRSYWHYGEDRAKEWVVWYWAEN